MNKISIAVIAEDEELIPRYATSLASGADLRANLKESLKILPGKRAIVPTGIFCEIPEGFELQVRPRSGFAAKQGITVLNTPGTIDADYRGEICVILINLGEEPFVVLPKMRIAQLVLAPMIQADFFSAKGPLTETVRGVEGFGHTGAH